MQEVIKLILGIVVLFLGIPVGDFLRSKTKDEMKDGKRWFKLLTLIGIVGGFVGLIIRNDWVMFSFFFVAIVTSRNLVLKK